MFLKVEFIILIAIGLWNTGYTAITGTGNVREILRLAKSAEMQNFMRTSVNPCNNFYTYACGNWDKINPAHNEHKTSVFETIIKSYDNRIVNLLKAPHVTIETDIERKVKYFYDSCLNKENIRKNYKEKLLSLMEEFGGMPALKGDQWAAEKFDWLEVIALILRKYGKQIIIGVDISADLNNNDINRLYIGQLDDIVPARIGEYYERLKLVYKNELRDVLGLGEEHASKIANEIIEFEKALGVGVVDEQDGTTIDDLVRLRMLEDMSETYQPVLNFTKFVATWLGSQYRLPVYEYCEVYLKNLRRVIEQTPKAVVANYIMWLLLEDFRLEIDNENVVKREMKCVDKVKYHFDKYLDNMIYREIIKHNADVVKDVQRIWSELKIVFEETLNSKTSEWLTENTRDKALEKLSAMYMDIGSNVSEDFTKEYGDLVIRTDDYFENIVNIMETDGRNYRLQVFELPKLLETVSASPTYAADYNKISMPASFLQPHFLWNAAYPMALKYATIGFIIAHEMSHGFDDKARKFDAKGNLNNWWDRNSTDEFQIRKECLRQQNARYKYGDKQLTKIQGENMADNIGVRLAYAAYEKWLDNSTDILAAETLPQLDYTPRQLFFIATTQLWCADINRQLQQILTTISVHPPEELRVLSMLSNYEKFAIEFQCPYGSKMNPHRKCIVY